MTSCKVVLIEDNPADVFLVQLALQENNVDCEMTTFNNGQEALKVLCRQGGSHTDRTAPDVILLDLNTPKSDGFEVLSQLRGTPHLMNVPVAILTSSAASSDKTRSERLGAVRYIQKPSQLKDFLSTVGQAVREIAFETHQSGEGGCVDQSPFPPGKTARDRSAMIDRATAPVADSPPEGLTEHDRLEFQKLGEARDQRWCKYLDRASRGEPQALADLYDESSGVIFSIASRILRNPAEAEEITLDVYTHVWRSAAQFDRSRGLAVTWLIMLARSRAIDRLRSIAARPDHGATIGGNLLSTPVALSSDDSGRAFVMAALQQLGSADRELLELAFYSGLSHSELATTLETPLGTVKTRVRAALGRLRKIMEG